MPSYKSNLIALGTAVEEYAIATAEHSPTTGTLRLRLVNALQRAFTARELRALNEVIVDAALDKIEADHGTAPR